MRRHEVAARVAGEVDHEVEGKRMTRAVKILVGKHPDGFVAYPVGFKGVVVGEGDTCEAALADVQSALRSHGETFGAESLQADPAILEAYVAETGVNLVARQR
jgi:hypothetical protein